MTPDVLLGLLLGSAIGVGNALLSYGLYRIARGRPDKTFYSVVLLGLLGRLGLALVLVALILVFVPVHFYAFIGALLVSVAGGLAVETLLVYRAQMQAAPGATPTPRPSL